MKPLLPSFKKPPLIETVLGVQFDGLPIASVHQLDFWKLLGKEWPSVTAAPILATQFESFPGSPDWVPPAGIPAERAPRLQIVNQSRSRMVQVQGDRLHLNWLGYGGDAYPRYERQLRSEFLDLWKAWTKFCKVNFRNGLAANQWELTYVNHLEKGVSWRRPADWFKLLNVPAFESNQFSVGPMDNIHLAFSVEIPPRVGRVHTLIRNGRSSNGKDILAIELTARGPIGTANAKAESIVQLLDIGRDSIVKMFAEITTATAHRLWGREQ